MPVKLVLFILLLIIIGAFIGLNFEFTSTIRIWPSEKGTFTDIPILISFFVMYMIGMLSVIPFFVGFRYRERRMKKEKTDDTVKKSENDKARGKTRILGSRSSHDESHDKSIDSE